MILTLFSCTRTLERLDLYLDRELSPLESAAVRGHLKMCHRCEEKFAFEQRFTDALRARFQNVSELENRALTTLPTRVLAALDELENLEHHHV